MKKWRRSPGKLTIRTVIKTIQTNLYQGTTSSAILSPEKYIQVMLFATLEWNIHSGENRNHLFSRKLLFVAGHHGQLSWYEAAINVSVVSFISSSMRQIQSKQSPNVQVLNESTSST